MNSNDIYFICNDFVYLLTYISNFGIWKCVNTITVYLLMTFYSLYQEIVEFVKTIN